MKPVFFFLPGIIFLAACGSPPPATHTANATPTGVGWIISPAEGVVRTHCVSPVQDHETAFAALQASGETLEYYSDPAYGVAVCKIETVGWQATPATCFGPDLSSATWIFFLMNRQSGLWEQASVGVDSLTIKAGDLLAFFFTTYDPTTFNPIGQPPPVSFRDVCP
ncbi:MAG: hypothetical protein V1495_03075 [Pseudomonadota bacterium]